MLVNRKQEWAYESAPQWAPPPVAVTAPRPYPSRRRQFLQLILLAATLAMLITIHSEYMVRAGYDLVEMKAQAAKLEKENDLLRLEIAKLKSPQRIQQIATSQFGMVVPQNAYYATAAKPAGTDVAGTKAGMASVLNMSKAEASKGR